MAQKLKKTPVPVCESWLNEFTRMYQHLGNLRDACRRSGILLPENAYNASSAISSALSASDGDEEVIYWNLSDESSSDIHVMCVYQQRARSCLAAKFQRETVPVATDTQTLRINTLVLQKPFADVVVTSGKQAVGSINYVGARVGAKIDQILEHGHADIEDDDEGDDDHEEGSEFGVRGPSDTAPIVYDLRSKPSQVKGNQLVDAITAKQLAK